MKMYSQDHGWRGAGFTIASNEEEARKQLKQSDHNYDSNSTLEVEEIELGWVLSYDYDKT